MVICFECSLVCVREVVFLLPYTKYSTLVYKSLIRKCRFTWSRSLCSHKTNSNFLHRYILTFIRPSVIKEFFRNTSYVLSCKNTIFLFNPTLLYSMYTTGWLGQASFRKRRQQKRNPLDLFVVVLSFIKELRKVTKKKPNGCSFFREKATTSIEALKMQQITVK